MFSSKKNSQILVSLMKRHGIHRAVVSPGSRNAPLVNDLSAVEGMEITPAVDERSAGFYALGMAEALHQAVAVVVTSGTAVANLLPAVAEAYYKRLPLVVVSADRPEAWIDQLDGQTLWQRDILGRFVLDSVSLDEPKDGQSLWQLQREANRLLLLCKRKERPIHFNVPFTEPLYKLENEMIMDVTVMRHISPAADFEAISEQVIEPLFRSNRPMIVIGQTKWREIADRGIFKALKSRFVVLHESLTEVDECCPVDELLNAVNLTEDLRPDFLLYLGGALVGKRLKCFLREKPIPEMWLTDPLGEVHDVFKCYTNVVECSADDMLRLIGERLRLQNTALGSQEAYLQRFNGLLALTQRAKDEAQTGYSSLQTVRYFEEQLEDMEYSFRVHYANSTAIRLANMFAPHFVFCNRGVNGIEGSLSAAAGMSVAVDDMVFCVIGDLSFFYDQNALWNTSLGGNLRIILLNNHAGGIFHTMSGPERFSVRDRYIAASHSANAEGICAQNDVGYLKATNTGEMQMGIVRLMTEEVRRPMLLEVVTDVKDDAQAISNYYKTIRDYVRKTMDKD